MAIPKIKRESFFLVLLFVVSSFHMIDMSRRASYQWNLSFEKLPLTIFYFLPEGLTGSLGLIYSLTFIHVLAAIGYLWKRRLGVFLFLAGLTFYIASSQFLQNVPWPKHQSGLITFFYLVLFYPAFKGFEYWSRLTWRTLFCGLLAMYFLAGFHKIMASGFSWANGTSLQAWVWGLRAGVDPLSEFILSSVVIAKWVQVVTLILELGAPLALLNRWIGIFWGLGILFFHIGIDFIFNYRYLGHGLLAIALCLIIKDNQETASASTPIN